MITPTEWASLAHLRPGDFRFPDKLEWSVVSALDRLIGQVGARPVILSDWRPFDENNPNSQHFYGRAIDTTWPGVDPLRISELTESLQPSGGFGAYVNEAGVGSFHHDSRPNRARWGGIITHPISPELGSRVKRIEYTGLGVVLGMLGRGLSAVVEAISDLPTEKKSLLAAFLLTMLALPWILRSVNR